MNYLELVYCLLVSPATERFAQMSRRELLRLVSRADLRCGPTKFEVSNDGLVIIESGHVECLWTSNAQRQAAPRGTVVNVSSMPLSSARAPIRSPPVVGPAPIVSLRPLIPPEMLLESDKYPNGAPARLLDLPLFEGPVVVSARARVWWIPTDRVLDLYRVML